MFKHLYLFKINCFDDAPEPFFKRQGMVMHSESSSLFCFQGFAMAAHQTHLKVCMIPPPPDGVHISMKCCFFCLAFTLVLSYPQCQTKLASRLELQQDLVRKHTMKFYGSLEGAAICFFFSFFKIAIPQSIKPFLPSPPFPTNICVDEKRL